MKKITSIVLFFFMVSVSLAQKKEIKGRVTDKMTNAPIEGVNIMLDKSKKGTSSKKDGSFAVAAKSNGNTLIFSCIGYAPLTVFVDKPSDSVMVQMTPVSTDNAEVVVIGYGTQKRSDVTGAISKFKTDKLDEVAVSRVDQALQGKIAGLQVQNTTSEAGAAPKITVRGISSIYAGASPLVVVDGQPVADGLSFINPADIESIEVLKDAASAAIYGSRGASGVILVTTKTGKVDKSKFHLKYSIGAKAAYQLYDVMSTTEYMNNLFYEAGLKATDPSVPTPSGSAIAVDNERAGYVVETAMRGGKGTDWQREALRTGLSQNLQLSASGGKSAVKYYVSGGFQKDRGMMINSNFENYNFLTKLDVDLSSKLRLVVNINPNYSNREAPTQDFTLFVRYPSFMPVFHNEQTAANVHQLAQWSNVMPGDYAQPRHFAQIYYSGIMPDGSMWMPTGNSSPLNSSTNNPMSISANTSYITDIYRLHSSAELTYKIRKGFDFKSLATSYVNYTTSLNWANRNAEADGMVSKGVFNYNTLVDLLSENTFNYTKQIKSHSITMLAGFTAQKTKLVKNQITGLNFPSDNIRTLNNASQIDKSGTFGTNNQIGLLSYLGRVNYAYQNKYLVSASFRSDGSSYFGPGRKWGSFPSLSLGWLLNKEKFMSKNKFFDKLKLRASYGVSGNNRILDFGFLDLLYPANYSFGSGNGTINAGQVSSPTIGSNADITWESTFQTNLGADISILKNRLNFTLDVYQSKTDRLLLQQSAMAFSGVPVNWNNIGSLQNRGIELEINTVNVQKSNFKWTTSANISHTENKVLELGKEAYLMNAGERNELYQTKVGNPLIQFFGFKTDGVWISQSDIDQAVAGGLTSPFSNAFVPGQLKIVDVDHNNIIDNNDRTVIGSPYPDFTWGITNQITWGKFDMSFLFQGVQGGSIINGDPNYDETKKLIRAYSNNRWISPMFPGDGKTPTYNKAAFNWMLTDYIVEDASYFSLREINIGYAVSETSMKRLGFNSMRVFCSGQNLYVHKSNGYRGINPEARKTSGYYSSALLNGYQRGAFPIAVTLLLGVDINF